LEWEKCQSEEGIKSIGKAVMEIHLGGGTGVFIWTPRCKKVVERSSHEDVGGKRIEN